MVQFRLRLRTLFSYDREHKTTAVVSLDNACCLLYIPESIEPGGTQKIAEDLVFQLKEQALDSILALEDFIGKYIKNNNFPLTFSLACIYLNGTKAYLKTHGEGEIYLVRGGQVHTLLTNTQHAVGPSQLDDLFILTIAETTKHTEDIGGWSKLTGENTDHIQVLLLTPADASYKDLVGYIQVVKEDELVVHNVDEQSPIPPQPSVPNVVSTSVKPSVMGQLKNVYMTYRNKRTFTIMIMLLIGTALIWSVALGVRRRTGESQQKRIQYTRELVTQRLQQAHDIVGLNSARAIALVNEAKKEVTNLKKDNIDTKSIDEIENLIKQSEAQIFKKEDKKAQEFYDLSLDNKQAKGMRFALSGPMLTIVDTSGYLYTLDIDKKSIQKTNFPKAKISGPLATSGDATYVVLPDGIHQIIEKSAKKVIGKDKEWGIISGLHTYGGNLYLLDKTNNQIYKYPGTGEGVYGDKSNYFRGNAPDMSTATNVSFAIDGSVYISTDDDVYKYTAGASDSFNVQFPTKVTITKTITSVDEDEVCIWDRVRSSIYVISKTGNYQRQIQSSSLKTATDVVVREGVAYLLEGQKIFKLTL